jgi:hypothetical protein
MRTEMPKHEAVKSADAVTIIPTEKLPARSLLILPRPRTPRLSDLGEQRRKMAA